MCYTIGQNVGLGGWVCGVWMVASCCVMTVGVKLGLLKCNFVSA